MSRLGLLLGILLLMTGRTAAQTPRLKNVADFGARCEVVLFAGDTVQLVVKSRPGEEHRRKPVLLWMQGSLPKPICLYDEEGQYGLVPFRDTALLRTHHLVIISKPGIPLVAHRRDLGPGMQYLLPGTGTPPVKYCQRNYLTHYVARNTAVLRYLRRQPWVEASNIVVAGHSEGSAIVAQLVAGPRLFAKAIYLSGNPLGRMASNLAETRASHDAAQADTLFNCWQQVVAAPREQRCTFGDTNRATYEFSAPPPLEALLRTKVPVFIGYGTLDKGIAGVDYLHLEAIRRHQTRLHFQAYPEREHNFFGLKDGQPNYDDFGWDAVGADFLQWLKH